MVRWVRHAAYKQGILLLAGQGAMGFTKQGISNYWPFKETPAWSRSTALLLERLGNSG
jgi:hypothetical protein